jgi:L-threonylcarbamoyladenylate synthase
LTSLNRISGNADGVTRCARALIAGELVAFPTETVYGLGADATNDHAVAAIFAAKNRPDFNPLIVHVTDMEAARQWVHFTPLAEQLAAAFWPGALSLVLPRREDCGLSLLLSAGLDSVAIRVPAHPLAHDLLTQTGRPIAAPSANRSGEVSPTMAEHVAASFANADIATPLTIIDGGACEVGLESSVVDVCLDTATLLRPGGITAEAISAITGTLAIAGADDHAPKSPGMLSRHYAPATPLRLNAQHALDGEALLAFGPTSQSTPFNLSRAGDLAEAAANLFALLHAMDAEDLAAIAVMPIPAHGLGQAINDRLIRAATDER